MTYEIDFGEFNSSLKHKKRILEFIDELVNVYSLQNNYFRLVFEKKLAFGTCFPAFNLKNRKAKITINKDLLNENLFVELKGCLAHEFAHFYHYANFSNTDFLKFAYRIGGFVYAKIFSKGKIIIFKRYNQAYEQITDLTACQFGYQNELASLKKYTPIYRKNLSSDKIPDSSHYLSYEFLKYLKKKDITHEAEKRKKLLGFKSLRYS